MADISETLKVRNEVVKLRYTATILLLNFNILARQYTYSARISQNLHK